MATSGHRREKSTLCGCKGKCSPAQEGLPTSRALMASKKGYSGCQCITGAFVCGYVRALIEAGKKTSFRLLVSNRPPVVCNCSETAVVLFGYYKSRTETIPIPLRRESVELANTANNRGTAGRGGVSFVAGWGGRPSLGPSSPPPASLSGCFRCCPGTLGRSRRSI